MEKLIKFVLNPGPDGGKAFHFNKVPCEYTDCLFQGAGLISAIATPPLFVGEVSLKADLTD
jgi:hypothetical protein